MRGWYRLAGGLAVAALATSCNRLPFGQRGGRPPAGPLPASAPAADAEAVVEEMFVRTNAERRAAGLPVLTRNVNLMVAAQIQASQMASRNLMAHDIPGAQYPTLRSRLDAVSYPMQAAAENIAAGYDGGRQVVTGWMSSPGHRANILSPTYTELGTSVARSPSGKPYYAQVFGKPR